MKNTTITPDSDSYLPSLDSVFREQRVLLIGTFAVAFLAIAIVVMLLPKRYESTMKVLVKKERADVVVTPGQESQAPAAADVTEADINSEVELLKSLDILRSVVLQAGLANQEMTGVQAAGGSSPVAVEKAMRKLGRELQINPIRKSNIIQVSYTSFDPHTAAEVLRDLADRYLNSHLALHGAPGTFDFFREQASRYGTELSRAESTLQGFREQHGLFLIDEQKDLLLRQISATETELASVQAQIQSQQQRISSAKKQLQEVSPRIVTQSRTLPNQSSVERLNTMLAELRNKRTEAATKFRSDDRMVVELDKQIADTQGALDQANRFQATEQATDVNPVRQVLESELVKAELERSAAWARSSNLAAELVRYRGKLVSLGGVTNQYDALMRQEAEAKQTYLLYKTKAEEARIEDSLDQQKIANVAIAETPREASIPSSPKVMSDLAMGAVFAAFLSLAIAFVAQYRKMRGVTTYA